MCIDLEEIVIQRFFIEETSNDIPFGVQYGFWRRLKREAFIRITLLNSTNYQMIFAKISREFLQ